ncbi:MAG: right-handed parallel beta-helix repeat-containing protein [Telluria sp.]
MHPRRRRTIRNWPILALLAILSAAAAALLLARMLSAPERSDGALLAIPGIGALARATALAQSGRDVVLESAAEVSDAIAQAAPGDVLTLLPGRYTFGQSLRLARPGRPDSKITLRAMRADEVFVDFATEQGFIVTAPDWRVENLTIRGACAAQADCEHAFHVVGEAARFAAINNTITDFNAHFKINGERGRFPDDGLIEGNTLSNGSVRETGGSVTVIDMVGVNGWIIRRNLISEFVKGGGDRISYGAFAKGGGARNVFEQNVVICESRLRGAAGQRVGLSLGGGGSGKQYCRDQQCITEQDQGVIRSNLIASCSDAGIYLNRAAGSRVLHNTLLDTTGIQARFGDTTGDVEGNLVDGQIAARNGASLRLRENRATAAAALIVGQHPVRRLFADDGAALTWREAPPRRTTPTPALPDLCAVTRPQLAALGAFEDLAQCRQKAAP